jgi:hypothetical protein
MPRIDGGSRRNHGAGAPQRDWEAGVSESKSQIRQDLSVAAMDPGFYLCIVNPCTALGRAEGETEVSSGEI